MFRETPHRRWNPLHETWVLVSPHRSRRPWKGKIETQPVPAQAQFDPTCYLCPGTTRDTGVRNPDYREPYSFNNDFPALLNDVVAAPQAHQLNGLVREEPTRGICRVVCYHPDHSKTFATMTPTEISAVIREWRDQYDDLRRYDYIHHVMIFENRGEMMGASNPHPHGQIWATEHIPELPLRSVKSQRHYAQVYGKTLIGDYMRWELGEKERVVLSNEHWTCIVPYWAVWPFETLLAPRRDICLVEDLKDDEILAWAEILSALARTYDRVFDAPFPFSMGLFQRPLGGVVCNGFHLHQSFFPPLLRSSTIRKFMVGYELCAEPQRDITPEDAAGRLREARP